MSGIWIPQVRQPDAQRFSILPCMWSLLSLSLFVVTAVIFFEAEVHLNFNIEERASMTKLWLPDRRSGHEHCIRSSDIL